MPSVLVRGQLEWEELTDLEDGALVGLPEGAGDLDPELAGLGGPPLGNEFIEGGLLDRFGLTSGGSLEVPLELVLEWQQGDRLLEAGYPHDKAFLFLFDRTLNGRLDAAEYVELADHRFELLGPLINVGQALGFQVKLGRAVVGVGCLSDRLDPVQAPERLVGAAQQAPIP